MWPREIIPGQTTPCPKAGMRGTRSGYPTGHATNDEEEGDFEKDGENEEHEESKMNEMNKMNKTS